MNILKSALFLAFLCLFSCEKEVTFREVEVPDRLVVNSLISPDSLISVHLSHTMSSKVAALLSIDGATIDLFENNIYLETLVVNQNGIYTSQTTRPSFGREYKLEINAQGYETTISSDITPYQKIEIKNLQIIKDAFINEDGNTLNEVRYTISDPEFEDNFYETRVIIAYHSDDETSYVIPYMTSKDPAILQEADIYYYPESILLEDNLFNGEEKEISLYYREGICYGCVEPTIIVELRSISSNFYKYKKSLIRHLNNQSSDIWDGMANPVQLFTNVENGYGIFASYTSDIDSVNYSSE
ncbi:MAG: DUF4249 domain-containing protein [Bacteroidales bacterium]|nr:DUF4249 domain-containing protein [Bacteroidales bacterium]